MKNAKRRRFFKFQFFRERMTHEELECCQPWRPKWILVRTYYIKSQGNKPLGLWLLS